MNDPIFRRALPSDWRDIRSLLATSSLPLDGAQDHLDSFLVAHGQSGLLGCAGLELYGPVALLRSVAVAQAHRGRRLGQELLARLLSEASKEKVETVVLLTETAEPYFRKLGFNPVSRSDLPSAVAASAEFQGACPVSATAMVKMLRPDT